MMSACQPPAGIALLPPDREVMARLGGLLRDRARLLPCGTEAALRDVLVDGRANLVVLAPPRGTGLDDVALVQRLHHGFPRVPIVVYGEWSPRDHRALVAMVKAGASELLRRGTDDGRAELRDLLDRASLTAHAEAIEQRLAPHVCGALLRFIAFGLRHPAAADDILATGRALGMARRTLALRLAALGAPSPRRILTWMRLLVAAALIADGGRTLDSVAFQMGLSSGNGLRLLVRRYGGAGVRARVHDGALLAALITEFLRRLRPPGRLDASPDHSLHTERVFG